MTKYTPENIQKLIKNVASANSEALSTQASFYQESMKRNTSCFSDLAKARMSSFQEMATSKTFTEAFEANASFEKKVRDELTALTEENTAAWKALTSNLQELYTFNEEESEEEVVAEKPKAKKPAKKAAEKTEDKAADQAA